MDGKGEREGGRKDLVLIQSDGQPRKGERGKKAHNTLLLYCMLCTIPRGSQGDFYFICFFGEKKLDRGLTTKWCVQAANT